MGQEKELKIADLSGCEKLLLGCIYEYHNQKQAAPNLKDILELVEKQHGIVWKMQTVCTFFSRMEKKGLLTIKKEGRYSYYYPVLPFEEYVCKELDTLCNLFFEKDRKKLKKFVKQL